MKAKHKESKFSVAIKRIELKEKNRLTSLKFIIREIGILRRLSRHQSNHFSVRLLDVVIPEEEELESGKLSCVFLVMDYYEHSLKQLISAEVCNFSEDHLIVLVYNLLCSINYLHSANVIHRDLKPSNILVTPECTVRICDFGLARTLDMTNSKRRETSPVAVSRWYRPPEIILCSDYDSKADAWSLGCIVAELASKMCSGSKGKSKAEVLFKGNSCYPISPCSFSEIEPKFKTAFKEIHQKD
mgnify:CR=1 FL=1